MGGIKNRDLKRAKNKVFTSGAGGSSKGPSVLDKRGQELQCQHCERVFKQSGRLQDHIKKQHADTLEGQAAPLVETTTMTHAGPSKAAKASNGVLPSQTPAAPPPPPAAPRMMDIGSGAGAYDVKSPKLILHEMLLRDKQPKAKYKTLPDPQATAWRCKVVLPHPKNSDKDVVVFLGEEHAAPNDDEAQQRGAVAALHRLAGDRAMDRILPQQYLGLWRALGRAEEARRARVSRDNERRAAQQAAQQAALKRQGPATVVMTEDKRRMLEDILLAEASQNQAGAGSMILTETTGEGFDEKSRSDGGWESFGWSVNETRGDGGVQEVVLQQRQEYHGSNGTALAEELVALGFDPEDAKAGALSALKVPSTTSLSAAAESGLNIGDGRLSKALDWLCLNVPEDRLPSNFAPGAGGKPVTVLLRSGVSSASLDRQASGASSASFGGIRAETLDGNVTMERVDDFLHPPSEDPAVLELCQYGYPPLLCQEALSQSNGHVYEALGRLFSYVVAASGIEPSAHVPPADAKEVDEEEVGSDLEEWREEREALSAIFDTEISFPSQRLTILKLNVVLESDAAEASAKHSKKSKQELMMDGAALELVAWAMQPSSPPQQRDDTDLCYPNIIPVLAVASQDVPPVCLLAVTRALAVEASTMVGCPMLHHLATHLTEALPDALLRPPRLRDLLRRSVKGDGDGSFETKGGAGATLMVPSGVDDSEKRIATVGKPSSADRPNGFESGRVTTTAYPPSETGTRAPHRGPRHRATSSAINIEVESKRLLAWHQQLQSSSKHATMRATRSRLPAASKKQQILSAVGSTRVCVISGATGCGKSTQVPQFLLEAAIEAGTGASCNVICTQPRRISAVGLATRVAAERAENVGDCVGYSVRLDTKQSQRTRLLFCTTGVLLRRLQGDASLKGLTHIVLDEVHERTVESDLLLMLLRDMLISGANPNLRVVLMSATADAQLFASYFEAGLRSPTAVLTIPGFTHPVTDLFLEDALEATGFVVGKSSKWAKTRSNAKTPTASHAGHGVEQTQPSSWQPPDNVATGDWSLQKNNIDGIQRFNEYSQQTVQSLCNIDESAVNHELIEALVVHVASTQHVAADDEAHAPKRTGSEHTAAASSANGAILIFAPGAEEIGRIVRTLQSSPRLAAAANPHGVRVLPLHGALPPSQQTLVFQRPQRGELKIVVSTNVAETSITIDDVTAVIDAGRVKEMRFDASRGLARLQETWVSQASAQQRRGRAGRVRPGKCWRLFSKRTWARMQQDTPPEVARAPLQALVMDIKGIMGERAADAAAVLGRMLSPPDRGAIEQAVSSLQRIGALDATSGALTPLGSHLVRMPCDPRLGKMLVFGAMLRCIDPVLTVAAAQSHGRPAFWTPADRRNEAEAAKQKLLDGSLVANSKSDHLAVVVAYNGWRAALAKGGRRSATEYCEKYFVSDQTMEAIHSGRRQYADVLADLGFLPAHYPVAACVAGYNPGSNQGQTTGRHRDDVATSSMPATWSSPGAPDQYAGHARVVKAALAAGFYPNLLRVEHPTATYTRVLGGALETQGEARKVRFYDRERGRAFLHPSSVNFSCGKFESGWLCYSEVVETSKVFVRESTMVPVYAVLLFGGEVSVHYEKGLVRVDGWASFKAPGRIAVLVRELRAAAAAMLARKVADPGVDLGSSRVVEAMHQLLSTDGF